MKNLVSIIVPIYNSEKYLSDCINSIINQSYFNIEVILINDGSSDNSLSICQNFEKNDSRIRVISKENGGVSSARNYGLEIAKGDYIAFVDSDDVINEMLYETLLKRAKSDKTDCVALSNYTIRPVVKNRSFNKKVINSKEALSRLFELRFPTSLWAYLYKKDTLKSIWLSNEIHFFEDFEFNFKALKICKSISICEEDLYFYRTNELSINAQGVNDKRLTCLLISSKVYRELLQFNNKDLIKKLIFLESHFLITVLAPLRFPIQKSHKKYALSAQQFARNILPRVIFSMHTTTKQKIVTTLVAININLSVFLWTKLRFILK